MHGDLDGIAADDAGAVDRHPNGASVVRRDDGTGRGVRGRRGGSHRGESDDGGG